MHGHMFGMDIVYALLGTAALIACMVLTVMFVEWLARQIR